MRLSRRKVRLLTGCLGEALAHRLEVRRVALGWSIRILAEKSGYSENTILRVLKGRNVNWRTVRDVAASLGYDLTLSDSSAA